MSYQLIEQFQKELDKLEEVSKNIKVDSSVLMGITENGKRYEVLFQEQENAIEFILKVLHKDKDNGR